MLQISNFKMAYDFVKLVYFLTILSTSACYCPGSIRNATTRKGYLSNIGHSSNETCTVYIRPSSSNINSSYFLEIGWESFNVNGHMPSCKNNYVEVFLTSSNRSIGKYCSNNMKSKVPFTMYSRDGYAKIMFYLNDSDISSGFRLTYRLRSRQSNYLGNINSSSCSPSTTYSYANTVFSQGWPRSYQRAYHSVPCTFKIFSGGAGLSTRLVFMDIDLNYWYYRYMCLSDYVKIKGSDYFKNSYDAARISGTMCSTDLMMTIDTTFKYLFIVFDRELGSSSYGQRGFVAGYVTYRSSSATEAPHAHQSTSYNYELIAIGCTIGVFFSLVILAFILYSCKNRQGSNDVTRNNQTINRNTTQARQNPVQPAINRNTYQGRPSTVPSNSTPYPQSCSTVNAGSSNNAANPSNPGRYPPPVSQGYMPPAYDTLQGEPQSAVTTRTSQPTSLDTSDDLPLLASAAPPSYSQVAVSR